MHRCVSFEGGFGRLRSIGCATATRIFPCWNCGAETALSALYVLQGWEVWHEDDEGEYESEWIVRDAPARVEFRPSPCHEVLTSPDLPAVALGALRRAAPSFCRDGRTLANFCDRCGAIQDGHNLDDTPWTEHTNRAFVLEHEHELSDIALEYLPIQLEIEAHWSKSDDNDILTHAIRIGPGEC